MNVIKVRNYKSLWFDVQVSECLIINCNQARNKRTHR